MSSRRKIERRAKTAASCLLKGVASGKDWETDSSLPSFVNHLIGNQEKDENELEKMKIQKLSKARNPIKKVQKQTVCVQPLQRDSVKLSISTISTRSSGSTTKVAESKVLQSSSEVEKLPRESDMEKITKSECARRHKNLNQARSSGRNKLEKTEFNSDLAIDVFKETAGLSETKSTKASSCTPNINCDGFLETKDVQMSDTNVEFTESIIWKKAECVAEVVKVEVESNGLSTDKRVVLEDSPKMVESSLNVVESNNLCRAEDFFSYLGLVKKSEMRSVESLANRLHRDAGGKLRRNIKLKMAPEMVYRRVMIGKGVSINGAMTESRVGVGGKHINRHVLKKNKLTPVRSEEEQIGNMMRKDEDVDLGADNRTRQDDSLSSLQESRESCDKTNKNDGETVVPKVQPEGKQVDEILSEKVDVSIQDDSPVPSRRSSRQIGAKRKEWGHLLRSNPYEHEMKPVPKQKSKNKNAEKPVDSVSVESPLKKSDVSAQKLNNSFAKKGSTVANGLVDHLKTMKSPCSPLIIRSKRPSSVEPILRAKHLKFDDKPEGSVIQAMAGSRKYWICGLHIEKKADVCVDRPAVADCKFDGIAVEDFPVLSYRYKESECIVPHMCNVCWVNDHMYCRNMKRISRDLPTIGGCIHYISCDHFYKGNSFRESWSPSKKTTWPLDRPGNVLQSSCSQHGDWKDGIDLTCDEKMMDFSDSELDVSDSEPLKYQLAIRATQIMESLGVKQIPNCYFESSDKIKSQEVILDDVDCVPEDYGAQEIVENCLEMSLHQIGETNNGLVSYSQPFLCSENSASSQSAIPQAVQEDSMISVKIPVLPNSKRYQSPNNPCIMKIQVQKLSSDRYVLTYPDGSPPTSVGDSWGSLKREVKFTNGDGGKALNEFLAQEAVRMSKKIPTVCSEVLETVEQRASNKSEKSKRGRSKQLEDSTKSEKPKPGKGKLKWHDSSVDICNGIKGVDVSRKEISKGTRVNRPDMSGNRMEGPGLAQKTIVDRPAIQLEKHDSTSNVTAFSQATSPLRHLSVVTLPKRKITDLRSSPVKTLSFANGQSILFSGTIMRLPNSSHGSVVPCELSSISSLSSVVSNMANSSPVYGTRYKAVNNGEPVCGLSRITMEPGLLANKSNSFTSSQSPCQPCQFVNVPISDMQHGERKLRNDAFVEVANSNRIRAIPNDQSSIISLDTIKSSIRDSLHIPESSIAEQGVCTSDSVL